METMNHVLKLMEEIKCINVCGELYVMIATRERCLVIVFRKLSHKARTELTGGVSVVCLSEWRGLGVSLMECHRGRERESAGCYNVNTSYLLASLLSLYVQLTGVHKPLLYVSQSTGEGARLTRPIT